ncbi:MAG: ABC transporter permease [Sedimentisphaerales bacterium]|nr:ABC transporter permease [Sedimentisphaerales bacterium]
MKKRVAYIAVTAVALLVMMVLVVLSVMSGLLEDTRMRNHRWAGDVVVARDSLVGFDGYEEFIRRVTENGPAEAATPVIRTFGLVGSISEPDAVGIFGVKLGEFCRVTGFGKTLHWQKEKSAASFYVPKDEFVTPGADLLTEQQRQRGFIAGTLYLAGRYTDRPSKSEIDKLHKRGLEPSAYLSWPITVFGLSSRGTAAGSGVGEQQRFFYVDDSDSGLVDVDMSAVYVDFDQLQKLCYMDGGDGEPKRASEIRVKLRQGVAPEQGRTAIAKLWREFVTEQQAAGRGRLLADVKVQSWQEYRRSFIAPAEKEKSLMVVVFAMIALVAIFIIFAIFYMIVMEKVKDLGIVKSVGGSGWAASQIFLGYGMLVGIVGAGVGAVAGCLIVWNTNELESWLGIKLWDPDVYAIERIPDVVDYSQAAVIVLVAILASVAGAAIPARKAAKLEVVEALRVE